MFSVLKPKQTTFLIALTLPLSGQGIIHPFNDILLCVCRIVSISQVIFPLVLFSMSSNVSLQGVQQNESWIMHPITYIIKSIIKFYASRPIIQIKRHKSSMYS